MKRSVRMIHTLDNLEKQFLFRMFDSNESGVLLYFICRDNSFENLFR